MAGGMDGEGSEKAMCEETEELGKFEETLAALFLA